MTDSRNFEATLVFTFVLVVLGMGGVSAVRAAQSPLALTLVALCIIISSFFFHRYFRRYIKRKDREREAHARALSQENKEKKTEGILSSSA